MKKSIATVSVSGMLPQKLAAISAARFDGVEIFENDLLQYSGTPRDVRRMTNVIARLPGTEERTVIAGAHRDADRGQEQAALAGQRVELLERAGQVALDVVGERLER